MSSTVLYTLAAGILTAAAIALRLVTRSGLLGAAIDLHSAVSESGDYLASASDSGPMPAPPRKSASSSGQH